MFVGSCIFGLLRVACTIFLRFASRGFVFHRRPEQLPFLYIPIETGSRNPNDFTDILHRIAFISVKRFHHRYLPG
jgi:hypothetical protein